MAERPRAGPRRCGTGAGILAGLALLLGAAPAVGAPPAPAGRVRLVAVGDIFFGRYRPRPDGHGKVYLPVTEAPDPFVAVAPLLRAGDVAFGNLETPVMAEPARFSINQQFTFRADPARAAVLRGAGLQVLSLANNHMTNLGTAGAPETRRHLEAAGLLPVGAGADEAEALRPALVRRNGLALAFVAFTLWNNDAPTGSPRGAVAYVRHRDFDKVVLPRVRTLRAQAGVDFVIASVHWGDEYEPHASDDQRRMARALVAAGADVVLGHHPHVLQEFERHRGAVIAYSLGNFLFDNPGPSRRRTAMLRLTLAGSGAGRRIDDVSLVPVMAGEDYLPRPARGADYRRLTQVLGALAPGFALTPEPPAPAAGAARREGGDGLPPAPAG
jgi:poly-gamma-glutamate capsule biosynthesis protein CapA/YwtB (metallophosphatase superfamily)